MCCSAKGPAETYSIYRKRIGVKASLHSKRGGKKTFLEPGKQTGASTDNMVLSGARDLANLKKI